MNVVEHDSSQKSLLHGVAALITSLVTFVFVWLIVGVVLNVVHEMFGWSDQFSRVLQALFRDIAAPWVGGFLGVSMSIGWFSRASIKFVFYGFSTIVVLILGAYLAFVGTFREAADISVMSFLWGGVTLIAGLLGAHHAAKEEGFTFLQ